MRALPTNGDIVSTDDDRAVLEALRNDLFVAHMAQLVRESKGEVEVYRRPSNTDAVFESHGFHRVPAPRQVWTRPADAPYRSRLRWALPITSVIAGAGALVLIVLFVVIPMLTALAAVLVMVVKAILAVLGVVAIIMLLAGMSGGGGRGFSGTFQGRMH
jgi:hypothetical protein